MRIKQRTVDSVTVLDLCGCLTRNDGYGEIRAVLGALLKQEHARFLLNQADVPYMDSTGIGELASVLITVQNHKGSLKLVARPKRIRELFDDEADALQTF